MAEIEIEETSPEPEDLLQMQLVVSMRIYDTLLTILRLQNAEIANKLIAVHEKFEYIGPLPFWEE